MKTFTKSEIVKIAQQQSVVLNEDWTGPGQVWPLIEEMMMAGCVVVMKLDGARNPEAGDNGKYTIIATGGPLGSVSIRGDFENLDDGLSYLIGNYHAVVVGYE